MLDHAQRPLPDSGLARLTRFALRHRRLVVVLWLLLTIAGAAFAGKATKALSQEFSVPGR